MDQSEEPNQSWGNNKWKIVATSYSTCVFSNVNKTSSQKEWKAYPLQNSFLTAKCSKLYKHSLIGEWLYE